MIEQFFTKERPSTPCLILDANQAQKNFDVLQTLLPYAKLYYAIKANPHPEILKTFIAAGAYFDAASIVEIELILSLGASAERICYGNIAKKVEDICMAYELGVRCFVVDSEPEVRKMADYAPGAKVYFRISTSGQYAVCPLSQKFGAHIDQTLHCIRLAHALNLQPYGIAFHVGSQQLNPQAWEAPIRDAAAIFSQARQLGITLQSLDLGGGFPVPYHDSVPGIAQFTQQIETYLLQYFPEGMPEIIVEPGRFLVATAGTLFAEVVLVSHKQYAEGSKRWIYLDVGVFGGLAEASDQMIIYGIETERQGEPVITALAGPTCDSMDIMYKQDKLCLPADLQCGDIIRFKNAGAYTTTYASIGFNGFAPLAVYCIPALVPEHV